MELYFATSNKNKFSEALELFRKNGSVQIKQLKFKHNEIRSDSLEEIALEAVEKAYRKIKKPVFVEDSGLFIESLNNFPGTYSAWVYKKIGNRGILSILKSRNRTAVFRCCIAYANGNKRKVFFGECSGKIALRERGKKGFGYDPIFIPAGKKKTFAQSKELKKALSHRYKAIIALKSYIFNKK